VQQRLQKIIARAGLASRRGGEDILLSGRVRVNGRVITELGAKADPMTDKIEVDGKRILSEAPRYLVLHKPRNVVSTLSDPEGRPTVVDLLKGADTRLFPVGRLDFATSGVLLLTNDGDFSNGLLHPKGAVPKTYVLKVSGLMQPEDVEKWRTGIRLEDGMTLPADVRMIRHEGDKTWLEVTIREGRNQQIRRMGEATGFPVMRLARTSFAGITSDELRPGAWRSLTVDELNDLKKRYGVPQRIRGAVTGIASTPPRGKRTWGRAPARSKDTPHEERPQEQATRAWVPDRAPKVERAARPDASGDQRAQRKARIERGAKPPEERASGRPERAPRADRTAKPEERGGRSNRTTRVDRTAKPEERGGRSNRGPRPEASRADAPRPQRNEREGSAPRPRKDEEAPKRRRS
jgi:23S rRNA pseudouridine2605 synthase